MVNKKTGDVENRSIKQLDIQVQSESVEAKPDGGWGWVIVACAFTNNFIMDGILYSSGIVLSELVRMYDLPAAHVSWIFSLLLAISLLSGRNLTVLFMVFIIIVEFIQQRRSMPYLSIGLPIVP